MMRSLIAIATLVFLASCTETPSKPTTSGGSSSGSGKIVTATPEESLECDGDLILEPHLPEECIPPEPVVQGPVVPHEPDPIVGTYRLFTTESDGYYNSKHGQYVFRIFPDNRAGADGWDDFYHWEREGEVYKFSAQVDTPGYQPYWHATLRYQSVAGEPHLIVTAYRRWPNGGSYPLWPSESLKISSDPSHQFDFYKVECHYNSKKKCQALRRDADGEYVKGGPRGTAVLKDIQPGWTCTNVGRRSYMGYQGRITPEFLFGDAPNWGDTLEECESRCEQALLNRFETVGEGNCSDYQG